MPKSDCIFCEINESKEAIVYEDDLCFAVFDKYPSDYGHMLVISKEHHKNMLESPDDLVCHMFLIAKRLANKTKTHLNADSVSISTNAGKEAGQVIFHFHIHLVPKYSERRMGFMAHRELTDEEADDLRKRFNS